MGAIELVKPTFTTDTKNREFQLYPNPARGSFTVHLNDNKLQEGRLIIRTVLGNIVMMKEFMADGGKFTAEISDLQQLSSGIYLIEVEAGGILLYKEKLIYY